MNIDIDILTVNYLKKKEDSKPVHAGAVLRSALPLGVQKILVT